jgi:type IV secretion system protein TrbI
METAIVTDASGDGHRPPEEMRLRGRRSPVTRLSRKVLIGLGIVAATGIAAALFVALEPHRSSTNSELYDTSHRMTPDGLANLPRD